MRRPQPLIEPPPFARLIAPVDTMGCDQAGDDLADIKPLTDKVSPTRLAREDGERRVKRRG